MKSGTSMGLDARGMGLAAKGDGEVLDAVEEAGGVEGLWGAARYVFYVGQAGQHDCEGDAGLLTGQGCAQAVVGAVAEGDMAPALAPNDEGIWIGEDCRVAIGRANIGDDKLMFFDLVAIDLGVSDRDTEHGLHG